MKRALCVNNFGDLNMLITKESDTIDSCLVNREICEDPNNKFLQVIPYVTFYSNQPQTGEILFVHYRRAATGGEDRLLSKASIGFGGHIDSLDEIKYSTSHTAEDGTIHFTMTKDQLAESIFSAAKRELTEELGVDVIEQLGITFDFNSTAFFTGNQAEEVNQVHVGLSIPIELDIENLKKFISIVNINKEEIDTIDVMTVSVANIVEEMDITNTLEKVVNELRQKLNLEDWSCRMFSFIVRGKIYETFKSIGYFDMYSLAQHVNSITNGILTRIQREQEQMKVMMQKQAEEIHSQLVPAEQTSNAVDVEEVVTSI